MRLFHSSIRNMYAWTAVPLCWKDPLWINKLPGGLALEILRGLKYYMYYMAWYQNSISQKNLEDLSSGSQRFLVSCKPAAVLTRAITCGKCNMDCLSKKQFVQSHHNAFQKLLTLLTLSHFRLIDLVTGYLFKKCTEEKKTLLLDKMHVHLHTFLSKYNNNKLIY